MKVAFSTWKNRISPVFDVSREIFLVHAGPGQETIKEHRILPDGMDRCLWIVEQGANFLVCGAISSHLQLRLEWKNVRIIPFVAGDISEVIDTWLEKDLRLESFNMPGCCFRMNNSGGKKMEVTMRVRNQRNSNIRDRFLFTNNIISAKNIFNPANTSFPGGSPCQE